MEQPNIVVCLSDMLRWSALGCYGNTYVRTPHIDRLAAAGVCFETAITNNPLCTPARSCLLTGQYSRTSTGMLGNVNAQWPSPERVRLPQPTLAERLRQAGYATELIGKWHIDPEPMLAGFDHALYPNLIHRYYGQQYVRDHGEPFRVERFAPEFELEHIRRFLRERDRDQPFFLFHNISQPHMPLGPGNCPRRYLDMYDRDTVPLRSNTTVDGALAYDREWFITYTDPDYWYRMWRGEKPRPTDTVADGYDLRDLTAQYDALVSCVDDQVGALMTALAECGYAENTIIVFTSDHGDNLGSHGCFNKGLLIEESIRVPLIVWAPGRCRPRVEQRRLAALIDIMPTVLDLCGLPGSDDIQGRSLAPALTGTAAAAAAPEGVFVETASGLIGLRTERYLFGMRIDPETGEMTDACRQFYDLAEDPFELHDLAGSAAANGATAAALATRLRHWHETTPWLDAPPAR